MHITARITFIQENTLFAEIIASCSVSIHPPGIFSEIPSQVSKFFLGIFQCSNVKSLLLSSLSEDTEVMVSVEAGTSEGITPPMTALEPHEDASFQKELKKHFAEFKSSDDLISRAKSLFQKFALLEGSTSCSVCKQLQVAATSMMSQRLSMKCLRAFHGRIQASFPTPDIISKYTN